MCVYRCSGLAVGIHHINSFHPDQPSLSLPNFLRETIKFPQLLYAAACMTSWQMQHFMIIAYSCAAQYQNAGFAMISGQR